MQFSKYVHFYDVGDETIGLFHSLLIRTIFLTKNEKQVIDLYLDKTISFPIIISSSQRQRTKIFISSASV